jgi:hypothetical protein
VSTEFGWWSRDPEGVKFQVKAAVHGGDLKWLCKRGRFQSWVKHLPTEEDWSRLISEAERRVPRRLLSPKQFEHILSLRRHR